MNLRKRAQAVIVGGGSVGCAVACSLAEAGRKDIIVIEKEDGQGHRRRGEADDVVGGDL